MRRLRRLTPLIGALVVALLFTGLSFGPELTTPKVSAATTTKPNVVVVVTDDQRLETLAGMWRTQELLAKKGTTFRRAMVPTALCCPSRATTLTGRYAHHTRVWGNGGPGGIAVGGWPAFQRKGNEGRTIATALSAKGYRTALVGKYLNFFGDYAPKGYKPPGWSVFAATKSDHGSYYNYKVTDGVWHGTAPADYSTDVYKARGVRFIKNTKAGRPLFLYFAPFGPHKPYQPAPRHVGQWEGKLKSYRAPSVNDPIDDMPRWLRNRPRYTTAQVDDIRQGQQESLMAVDEAITALVRALRETRRMRNTLFIFTSDNGYLWGDHTHVGKDVPYAAALRVPLLVRWDGRIPAGRVDYRLALNVDIAQTISKATGANMRTDGLSLLGRYRRSGFVLEAGPGYGERPAYCGWRTKEWMYARYATGERELYNYRTDPWETTNLAKNPRYARTMKLLRSQAKANCVPEPPGFDW